eukprot:CAMPEP_0169164512 /NCGR_PEP_ID=MMETSP1015-20121227/58886_1 /TAXON_ID=342587 /ORGANISM="Karlodinium micrum, Strain CCMP2283" /LENGTH=107 /DNA_ID=CAMNT_0009236977 /DNA_START=368 /DNA_END=691 /DNA_ORIENTATION=+
MFIVVVIIIVVVKRGIVGQGNVVDDTGAGPRVGKFCGPTGGGEGKTANGGGGATAIGGGGGGGGGSGGGGAAVGGPRSAGAPPCIFIGPIAAAFRQHGVYGQSLPRR